MDDRSDIFGLGAILYEIVCGQLPYGNIYNPDLVVEKARRGEVIPIDRFAQRYHIPRRLWRDREQRRLRRRLLRSLSNRARTAARRAWSFCAAACICLTKPLLREA